MMVKLLSSFSTIQYNTTVKPRLYVSNTIVCFSTIQYNTTVKPMAIWHQWEYRFSTIQYNTTVKLSTKPQVG